MSLKNDPGPDRNCKNGKSKQGIARLHKIRETEILCKKFGELWNKTDIMISDPLPKTNPYLGDMKSSDSEEMKSIMDGSSGDEDTSYTLEIDWVVSYYDWTIGNLWH